MCNRRADLIFGVFALPLFFSGAIANAGTVLGMDGPHRVPWAFRVELKRERIISFKRLEHIGPQEINTRSAKWLAAMATIDAEIAQIVTKLAKAHPHVQISSVTGRNNPGFLLRGSDEEARAMADEACEVLESCNMNPSVNVDPLPYDLHTNRELEFMLNRGKPLAHFSDSYPSEADEEIIPELAFAPYVQASQFVTREYVEPLPGPAPGAHPQVRGIRHVFYARSAEAWRIDAYIMMIAAAAKAGWSEGFERMQGSLLGYEEWQTDLHLERLRSGAHAKKFYWVRKP